MERNYSQVNEENQKEVLIRITNALNTYPELTPILNEICAEAAQALGIDSVCVLLFDEISNIMRIAASFGFDSKAQDEPGQISYSAFVESMVNPEYQLVIPNAHEYVAPPFSKFCLSRGMFSVAIIGITSHDRLSGALVANTYTAHRTFLDNDIILLRILAKLAEAALIKSRLSHEHRRRTRELEMLTLVSSSLRLAEKSEDMLPILVNNAREVFSADVVSFYLEETRSKHASGVVPQQLALHAPNNNQEVLFVPRSHPIWKIAEAGPLPLYITVNDLEQKLGRKIFYSGLETLHAFAISSVKIADGVIALLFLGFKTPHIFPDDERRLLQALSEMGGNALQRAGMMETLEQRVADRTHELGALYDIARVTSEYSDLHVILEKSLDNVLKIIGCEIGFIHLLEENGPGFDLTVQQGNPPDYLETINFTALKLLLWKMVIERNTPLLITNPELDTGITEIFPGKNPPTYLGVPIHAKGNTFGVLSIFGKDSRQFKTEEIALLSAIGDQMGVAVESARLREQAEKAAVMEERQRLARELHDAVSQSLYSLTLLSEACRQSIKNGNVENIGEWINDISQTSHDALKEMRLLLYELRPSMIEKDGFIGAIKRRLESVESRAGVNTHLNVEGECQLPMPIAEQLYRIVQEALNNILKHASATEVILNLKFDAGNLRLDIIDNGIGLNPDKDYSKGGLGLSTMKERAEFLGGLFSIESAPGNGTKISIAMEIPNA